DCAVVLHIAGAVEQSHFPLPGLVQNGAPRVGIPLEFRAVATPEFRPPRHLVTIPPAQVCARCHVLPPLIRVQVFLRDAPRPETLDKDAQPVVRRFRLVDTLDADLRHGIPSIHRPPFGMRTGLHPVWIDTLPYSSASTRMISHSRQSLCNPPMSQRE